MKSGIYMIQSPSGGVYIGSSVRLKFRKTRHMSDLRHNRHHTEPLQRAWNKYEGNLTFHVIEYCMNETLLEREQWWIDYIISTGTKLYNGRKTADAGGQPLEDGIRQKISDRMMGRKKSEETKQRMRKPKSAEHAAAISKGKKGVSINLHWSDEARLERSILLKEQHARGERLSVGAKISAALRNPEAAAKRSAAIRATWTPEKHAANRQMLIARHAARDKVREHMDRLNWILAG